MPGAERATWNPDDPTSVRAAVRGLDTLVYLVGVPYHQFDQHPVVMGQTLGGAIAEGVQRMVLIGTVYPYGCPGATPVKEDHPREPHTFKGRMRKAQEDLLLEADAAGKIRGTILRLPDFYGSRGREELPSRRVRGRACRGGRRTSSGPSTRRTSSSSSPTSARCSSTSPTGRRPTVAGGTSAGRGPSPSATFATKVFAAVGRTPKLRVAGKTLLRLMGLFNPMMRELVEMSYLHTTPVVLDDSAIQKLLGPVKKTSYDEGIRTTLDSTRGTNAVRAA